MTENMRKRKDSRKNRKIIEKRENKRKERKRQEIKQKTIEKIENKRKEWTRQKRCNTMFFINGQSNDRFIVIRGFQF